MCARTGLKVTVAGAGALGSILALLLGEAGGEVTLVDPGGAPNASAVAAGMIAPAFEAVLDGDTGIDVDLLRQAAALWDDLAPRLGVVLDRAGALAVGSADDLADWEARGAAMQLGLARLSCAEAEAMAPGLSAPAGALHTALDSRLDARAALAALARATPVQRRVGRIVDFAAGHVRLEDGEGWGADRLVVATGAARGLAALAPELAALAPIKGHILRLAGGPAAGPVVRMARGYVCPDPGGAVVGASMQPGRCDLNVEPAVVDGLLQQARRAFPGLSDATPAAETGVRAAAPDHLPLAGRSRTPDVWIAGGARRNGWLLAPLIARALADALAGDGEPQLPAGFDPRRFG